MYLRCQLCGGEMQAKTISSGNCLGIITALIVLVIGVALILLIPVLGWIVGGLMVIAALFMGGKRQKVWQCHKCKGHILRS